MVFAYVFVGAVIVASVVCAGVYIVMRRAELRSGEVLPISVWSAYADSLPEPQRTTMHRLIHRRQFPIPALLGVQAWLRATRAARREKALTTALVPRRSGVYVLHSEGRYKIGCSSDMYTRIQSISTSSPFEVTVVHVIICYEPERLEAQLHKLFARYRVRREWFALDDAALLTLADLAQNPVRVATLLEVEA